MKEGYGEVKRNTGGWYDSDNGQWVSAIISGMTCQHWQCQEWDGDTPIAPLLILFDRGRFSVRMCPKCNREYGIVTPRSIDAKTGKRIYDPL